MIKTHESIGLEVPPDQVLPFRVFRQKMYSSRGPHPENTNIGINILSMSLGSVNVEKYSMGRAQ